MRASFSVGSSPVQYGVHVLLRRGNGLEPIGVHQHFFHGFREKDRQGGAEIYIFDAQGQQRKQNAHGLLLIPRQHEGQEQLIDGAAESLCQGQSYPDGTVGIEETICLARNFQKKSGFMSAYGDSDIDGI